MTTPAQLNEEALDVAREELRAIGLSPSPSSIPFWQSVIHEQRIVLPCCTSCGRYRFPPSAFCPQCRSREVRWVEPDSPARVYSYTVATHGFTPELKGLVPYVIALIEYDGIDNVRLIANIDIDDLSGIDVGVEVVPDWTQRDPGFLTFRVCQTGPSGNG